jgi:hypothetical protein
MPLEKNTSQIAREFDHLSGLYQAQPTLTQHFLDQQATVIISALEQDKKRIHFQLPDRIILEGGTSLDIPSAARSRTVGSALKRLSRIEKRTQLIQLLNKMETGINLDMAVCGKLFRYALARTMVHHMLPDGRPIRYQPEADDDIPSIPVDEVTPSALLAVTDVVTELNKSKTDSGKLQTPYVAAARRFYLPQWVAFDEKDELLTGSIQQAEAHISSLQNAVHILQDAEAICPCVVVDEAYQRKRAGLLGQLVNQGRALARYYTSQIINKIRVRAETENLNRGLRLSLPYFEIEDLSIHLYPVEIIPDGRIMFVSAFVVRAMRLAEAQVRRDTHIGFSSRRHLLAQLSSIENAFDKHSQ